VIIVGEEEIRNQRYALKELASGEQDALDVDGLIEKLGRKGIRLKPAV
jgi:histidyl-tRNA synthetase